MITSRTGPPPVLDYQKEFEIKQIAQHLRNSDSAFVSCLLNQIKISEQRKSHRLTSKIRIAR